MQRFIAGTNILSAIKKFQNTPFVPIFDYAKESSTTKQESYKYASKIKQDVNAVPPTSAFALKYSSFNDSLAMSESVNYLLHHVNPVLLDAENQTYHEREKQLYDLLLRVHNQQETKLYKTYQMYRVDSMKELVQDIKTYPNLGIKLVRGAYYETDKSTSILFTNKSDTDSNYNNAIKYIIYKTKTSRPDLKLMIATHNLDSVNLALNLKPTPDSTSFAQLMGMKDSLGNHIISHGYKVYKYAPYGSISETYPYLLRRLHENSFIVRHIM